MIGAASDNGSEVPATAMAVEGTTSDSSSAEGSGSSEGASWQRVEQQTALVAVAGNGSGINLISGSVNASRSGSGRGGGKDKEGSTVLAGAGIKSGAENSGDVTTHQEKRRSTGFQESAFHGATTSTKGSSGAEEKAPRLLFKKRKVMQANMLMVGIGEQKKGGR